MYMYNVYCISTLCLLHDYYMLVWPARPTPPLLFTMLRFINLNIIIWRGDKDLAGQTNYMYTTCHMKFTKFYLHGRWVHEVK